MPTRTLQQFFAAAMIVGLLAPLLHADYGSGDSNVFSLNLLTLPENGTVIAADSAAFSLDITGVNRGSADSNAFSLSGAGQVSDVRITSLNANYTGVFAQGVDVFNSIIAIVDWAGRAPDSVVFELNGNVRQLFTTGGSAQTLYNMGLDLTYSRGGTPNLLTAYAIAADGARSQVATLTLYGLALPQWAISLETMEDLGFRIDPLTGRLTFYGEVEVLQGGIQGTLTVPNGIPEVGGRWGVEINPLNFEWELSAQPRYGDGAGITGTFDLAGTWGAELKAGTHRRGALSASIGGAGEFYPEFRLSDVHVTLAGSLTFLFPRVPLLCQWTGCCHTGYCPYFQASIRPEFIGTVGLEEGDPPLIAGLRFRNGTLQLAATLAGTVGAGSEGSIYYIAGTIGGRPSITFQFPGDTESECFNEYIRQAAFDLIARFVVECAWWRIEEEWVFNLLTCPDDGGGGGAGGIWDGGRGKSRVVTLVSRDYLSAPEGYCVFGQAAGAGPRSPGEMPEPILNVGTGPTPALAASADNGLLLFVYDDALQPTGQHQEIYFARWDGGGWTQHAPLTVNSRPDFQPAAAIDADAKELAVWVQAPQPTGDETDPRDVLPGFDIVYAVYDAGTQAWSAVASITNNNHVDMLPWIERLPDGALRACWIASVANAIPVWHDEEVNPVLDLMAADWNGTAFGPPYSVATGLSAVSPPALGRSATHEFLAYSKDTDENSGTAQDREIAVRVREIGQSWSADEQLTNDAISDTAVQLAIDANDTPLVAWVKRMVPITLPDMSETYVDQLWFSAWSGGAWSAPALAIQTDGIAEPKLIRNEAGRLVLFWVAASAEFSDVYYDVYDADRFAWGAPQQVTHDVGAETMLALSESGGNILATYVKRRIELDPAGGLPQIGLSDIYLMQHAPTRELSVGAADIGFDPNPPIPGETSSVCAAVRLSGDFTVADVLVSFYDGDPAQAGVLIGSDTLDVILPGQALSACVAWSVPNDGVLHQVYVVVDPDNTIPESDDAVNNTAYASPFIPDLRISAPGVVAYPGPDTILLGCTIRNDGSAEAGASMLEIRRDDANGPILITQEIPELTAGDSVSVQFAWDVGALATGIYSLVFSVDSTDAVAEAFESNNVAITEAAVRGDLQAEQWSGTYSNGDAQVVIRNVGAKPMAASLVRAVRGVTTLGEVALPALDAGQSANVSIPLTGPIAPGWLWLVANPDSDGSDEVSLLNNAASAVVYPTGDIDGNGVLDSNDVDVFVAVLLGLETDPYRVAAADIDLSGAADGQDVQPFITLLLAP